VVSPRVHEQRRDNRRPQRRKEPLGRGAVEASCREDLRAFQRTGQFWVPAGKEAQLI
jgi:hypothetical protein